MLNPQSQRVLEESEEQEEVVEDHELQEVEYSAHEEEEEEEESLHRVNVRSYCTICKVLYDTDIGVKSL